MSRQTFYYFFKKFSIYDCVLLAVLLLITIFTPKANPGVASMKGMVFIGTNSQGYGEYRHEKTGMIFVLIPEGAFRMGSNESFDEKPIREVDLDAFLISKYEVTQGQWQKVMLSEVKSASGGGKNPSYFNKGDNYPVEQVSWYDCQEFCDSAGLRLPTEAEWEYAGGAGTIDKYHWGESAGSDFLWFTGNSEDSTHQVGQKKPNKFGLFDMSGNVWEWCLDWFGQYSRRSENNPIGPSAGCHRVMRGGSWINSEGFARTSFRSCYAPDYRNSFIGFRCAMSVN